MRQVIARISLAALLVGTVGFGTGCQKKSSETVVVDDEDGTFEEIGEGVDKTKESAEETAKQAEETVDKVEDAADGN